MKNLTDKDKFEILSATHDLIKQAEALQDEILRCGGYYCPESGFFPTIYNINTLNEKLQNIQ